MKDVYITDYIKEVNKRYTSGEHSEHNFRTPLNNLISVLCPQLSVTEEPHREQYGVPDIMLKNKDGLVVCHIETKAINESLDDPRYTKQIEKYLAAPGELIYTNYTEFRFYKGGVLLESVSIAELVNQKITAIKAIFWKFLSLLGEITNYEGEAINNSERFIEMMAAKTRLIADVVKQELESDLQNNTLSYIRNKYEALLKMMSELTVTSFVDIYSQTIVYGLFEARLYDSHKTDFTLEKARNIISQTSVFLKGLFGSIVTNDMSERQRSIIENYIKLLDKQNIQVILANLSENRQAENPIISLYENYLEKYDPNIRKERGVWYTPDEIVKFMVRAVDAILQADFHLADGLADSSKIHIGDRDIHKLQILDPATGTGTFLVEIIRHIHSTVKQTGMWSSYVKEHLLPRIYGFECLMASYILAHLKLSLVLQDTGFAFNGQTKINVLLTNSLEEPKALEPIFARTADHTLVQEIEKTHQIKSETPLMVIIGNPPYNIDSQNKNSWIMGKMKIFKKEPTGADLKERNQKQINDDYVKFIRFAQHMIESKEHKEGVIAFINNNNWVDAVTFRGMRHNLLTSFDKIYIINLHGSSRMKEVSPDGTRDENVFKIMQGVAINIFVKTGEKAETELATVYHTDIFGSGQSKREILDKLELNEINFTKIEPVEPYYFFVPKVFQHKDEYEKGFSVKDLFPISSVGITTARDEFTIHYTQEAVKTVIKDLTSLSVEATRERYNLRKDTRDWKVSLAKSNIQESVKKGTKYDNSIKGNPKEYPNFERITQIAYRPFDVRWTYYTGKTKGFHSMPRNNVMKHLLNKDNFAMMFCRQFKVTDEYHHTFISKYITEMCYVSNNGSEGGYVCPLYLFPDNGSFANITPNINPAIANKIAEGIGLKYIECLLGDTTPTGTISPLQIFDYVYAVLHNPKYRETYKEYLRIDFPIIPYPADLQTFYKMVGYGATLRKLHLLEVRPDHNIARFAGDGNNIISKKVSADDCISGKLYINETQYFQGISQEVLEFTIGAYQPAIKWLRDRHELTLDYDMVMHYQKTIFAISETLRIMGEMARR